MVRAIPHEPQVWLYKQPKFISCLGTQKIWRPNTSSQPEFLGENHSFNDPLLAVHVKTGLTLMRRSDPGRPSYPWTLVSVSVFLRHSHSESIPEIFPREIDAQKQLPEQRQRVSFVLRSHFWIPLLWTLIPCIGSGDQDRNKRGHLIVSSRGIIELLWEVQTGQFLGRARL